MPSMKVWDQDAERRVEEEKQKFRNVIAGYEGGPFVGGPMGLARAAGMDEKHIEQIGTAGAGLEATAGAALNSAKSQYPAQGFRPVSPGSQAPKPMVVEPKDIVVPPVSGKTAISVDREIFRLSPRDKIATAWDAHDGNIDSDHRYSEKGIGAVYGADSIETAGAETRHYGAVGNKLPTSKNVKMDKILDLTNENVRAEMGITVDHIARDDYAFTQEIAQQAKKLGYNGIKAPSARNPSGWNIVIFK